MVDPYTVVRRRLRNWGLVLSFPYAVSLSTHATILRCFEETVPPNTATLLLSPKLSSGVKRWFPRLSLRSKLTVVREFVEVVQVTVSGTIALRPKHSRPPELNKRNLNTLIRPRLVVEQRIAPTMDLKVE